MTVRKPVVMAGGRPRQLPAGDVLSGAWVSFTTDWASFSLGGEIIITNTLGGKAEDWNAELKCFTAQGGYSVDEEVPCLLGADSYTNAGFQVSKNTSAEIRVRCGSSYGVSLLSPGTGANFRTTPASWKVRFTFWRRA